jgi:thiol-disulfide isomerase/thioredoxin
MENRDENTSRWLSDRLSTLQPDASWQPDTAHGLAQFREGRRLRRARVRRRFSVVIGSAAVILAVLAFPMTRSLAEKYATACVSLLRHLSDSGTNPAYTNVDYRKPAPAFTLPDSAGRSVTLADLRGKVVLLAFWTPKCAACETEMSWFREFEQEYGKHRLVFLNHQAAPGADAIVDSFGGLHAIPTALLIDKSGRIAVMHGGFCSRGDFETAIRALLNEP